MTKEEQKRLGIPNDHWSENIVAALFILTMASYFVMFIIEIIKQAN